VHYRQIMDLTVVFGMGTRGSNDGALSADHGPFPSSHEQIANLRSVEPLDKVAMARNSGTAFS